MLVSTWYDEVDVVVDSKDETVSKVLIRGGSWGSNSIVAMNRFVK